MTSAFGGQRSIQLSYGCKPNACRQQGEPRRRRSRRKVYKNDLAKKKGAKKKKAKKKKARKISGPSITEVLSIALDQFIAKQ